MYFFKFFFFTFADIKTLFLKLVSADIDVFLPYNIETNVLNITIRIDLGLGLFLGVRVNNIREVAVS